MCICVFTIAEVYDNRFSGNIRFCCFFWAIGRILVYSWFGNCQSDLVTHAIYTNNMPWET